MEWNRIEYFLHVIRERVGYKALHVFVHAVWISDVSSIDAKSHMKVNVSPHLLNYKVFYCWNEWHTHTSTFANSNVHTFNKWIDFKFRFGFRFSDLILFEWTDLNPNSTKFYWGIIFIPKYAHLWYGFLCAIVSAWMKEAKHLKAMKILLVVSSVNWKDKQSSKLWDRVWR